MLKDYFLRHHIEDLKEILNDSDDCKIFPIYVDFFILFYDDTEKANKIITYPRQYLPLCDASAVEAQENIAEPHQIVKKRIRTRIIGINANIEQTDIGQFVLVTGVVVRVSQPSVITIAKHLLCKKCKHVTIVNYEWETSKFADTRECEACKKTLNPETALDDQECVDYQEIKIQEKSQDCDGNISSAVQVVLLEDLVDKCTSGDNVNVCGYLIRKWGPLIEGQRAICTTFLLANNLSVRKKTIVSNFCTNEIAKTFGNYWKHYEDKPLDGRDNILASICPQLYGMFSLKLALALVLAGGVTKTNEAGSRVRGDIHLLLCGDPGTGKSQILKAATKLANRSVLTTGVGTTAAGLTAAAMKDSDGWHLEAGALVSANGGVCCIDELTTMSSHDMSCIHEAMEQQTISIAKAGLISTLNTRCSVIAAINPVGGRFVDGEEVKMRLGGPLLSRFDLILYLRDKRDPTWDDLVATHILETAMSDASKQDENIDETEISSSIKTTGLWGLTTLSEYFVHVHNLKPSLSKEAEQILCATYSYHRQRPNRRQERTTVRLLDSLVRLAEAHAKLMYRSEVLIMDAIFAADLVDLTDSAAGENSVFPTDPMTAYKEKGAELLDKLNLNDLAELL